MAAQGLLLPRSIKPAAGNDLHRPGPRRPYHPGLLRRAGERDIGAPQVAVPLPILLLLSFLPVCRSL